MKIYCLAIVILILFGELYTMSAMGVNLPGNDDEMVLVAGGEFDMGTPPHPNAKYVDNALHSVKVDSFYIDKYEVTNAQYLEFCEASDHKLPEFWDMDAFFSGPDFPDHPVVGVTWADAMDYAGWKGKRLPTEAEWEFAARGGLAGKAFPNGNEMTPELGNYNGTQGHAVAVGSFPPNAYGSFPSEPSSLLGGFQCGFPVCKRCAMNLGF